MLTGITLIAQQGETLLQHDFDELEPALEAYQHRIDDVGGKLDGLDLIAYIDGVLNTYHGGEWHPVH